MLRSFWIVISFIAGLAVIVVTWSIGWPRPVGIGLLAGALLVTAVFFLERLIWLFYRGWNRFLVRPFAALAGLVVTRLCYFIVFAAVGRAGSRFPQAVSHPNAGFWIKRDLPDPRSVPGFVGASSGIGWVRNYLTWSFQSGNAWAATLLPFLMILRACSRPQADAAVFDIYTLF